MIRAALQIQDRSRRVTLYLYLSDDGLVKQSF